MHIIFISMSYMLLWKINKLQSQVLLILSDPVCNFFKKSTSLSFSFCMSCCNFPNNPILQNLEARILSSELLNLNSLYEHQHNRKMTGKIFMLGEMWYTKYFPISYPDDLGTATRAPSSFKKVAPKVSWNRSAIVCPFISGILTFSFWSVACFSI